MQKKNNYHTGAVAIFSVVFATLLILVVSVSFLALMMKDREQAINTDLSESAYDSAMAGVEDAKRLIARYNDCKGSSTSACNQVNSVFEGPERSTTCTAIIDAGLAEDTNGEVIVGGTEGDELNQAYTCARLTMNTEDYVSSLSAGAGAEMVPLRASQDFSRVEIQWYSQRDNEGPVVNLDVPQLAEGHQLPARSEWPSQYPSLLRTTIVQPGGMADDGYELFDRSEGASTAFLYPSNSGSREFNIRSHDHRDISASGNDQRAGQEGPRGVECSLTLAPLQEYFCRATLDLNSSMREAYLNIAAFYNRTDFRVRLLDSRNNTVRFNEVQPLADVTGRASDIFRRVEARIELRSSATYPDAAVDTQDDFCKNFMVTRDSDEFSTECNWN